MAFCLFQCVFSLIWRHFMHYFSCHSPDHVFCHVTLKTQLAPSQPKSNIKNTNDNIHTLTDAYNYTILTKYCREICVLVPSLLTWNHMGKFNWRKGYLAGEITSPVFRNWQWKYTDLEAAVCRSEQYQSTTRSLFPSYCAIWHDLGVFGAGFYLLGFICCMMYHQCQYLE